MVYLGVPLYSISSCCVKYFRELPKGSRKTKREWVRASDSGAEPVLRKAWGAPPQTRSQKHWPYTDHSPRVLVLRCRCSGKPPKHQKCPQNHVNVCSDTCSSSCWSYRMKLKTLVGSRTTGNRQVLRSSELHPARYSPLVESGSTDPGFLLKWKKQEDSNHCLKMQRRLLQASPTQPWDWWRKITAGLDKKKKKLKKKDLSHLASRHI